MSFAAALRQTFDLERQTTTKDSAGGTSRTWAASYSSVTCCVWPAPGNVVNDYARRDITVNHQIVMATDVGAKATDRAKIGSDYYLVHGYGRFNGLGSAGQQLYLIDAELRIV